MRLYTIQATEAWTIARKIGKLAVEREHITEDYRSAYDWMRQQMLLRIPRSSGRYPIWAWLDRPDLRRAGHGQPGSQQILMTLEIPAEQVLLSSFDAWHAVLNNSFLALNAKEDQLMSRTNVTQAEIERSWERVFDLKAMRGSRFFGNARTLQACIETVELSNIISTRIFIAR